MATLETCDVALVTEDKYIKCAHVIHWLEDNFDPTCDDTYCLVYLDDEYVRAGLPKLTHNICIEEVIMRLNKMEQQLSDINHKGISLSEFIDKQDGFFYMKKPLCPSELEHHDGDEFDCGTYVECVLEDLELTFGVPVGTHTTKIVEDLVRSQYPEFIEQLPAVYIPHKEVA